MAHACDGNYENGFFMLGVIHRDARNDAVIEKCMDDVKPGVVTLELSPYGLAFRQERGREYTARIDDIFLRLRSEGYPCRRDDLRYFYSYVRVPHEYVVARDYCLENKADLHLVDAGLFSYMKLRKIDELINEENIRKNLFEDTGAAAAAEGVLARLYFKSGVSVFRYTDEMAFRDRFMSRRIAGLMKRSGGKRFLHVTGWRHLKDPLGLYTPLNPVKIYPYD